MTIHLDTKRSARLAARPGAWTRLTVTCGTEIVGAKYAAGTTENPAEVTCKRCLKAIETGMAETGRLAHSAEAKAARAARTAE